jgi:hypothetical protein
MPKLFKVLQLESITANTVMRGKPEEKRQKRFSFLCIP